ncbi:hypothetical protein E5288_WYG016395 [Bos mutus]|uniref:Uncharacterized protein n=1 Tax=Bos mutus TaxID=72004 RepID=A0A6B0RCA3_9CETA|nr:hypothetical protein [Bos mutus]
MRRGRQQADSAEILQGLTETRHQPSAPRSQDMPFELHPENRERSFGYIVAPDGQGAVVPQCMGHWTGPRLKDSGWTMHVFEAIHPNELFLSRLDAKIEKSPFVLSSI